MGDVPPIATRPYRIPEAQKEVMRDCVEEMLKHNVIEPSNSPWCSPVLLVPKPNGQFRFVADFRKLNAHVRQDKFPLPNIEQILSGLNAPNWFSTLDLDRAFFQMEVEESSRDYTSFSVLDATYRFVRLPFGLSTSPNNYQRLINAVMSGLTGNSVYTYIDDLIIFTRGFDEHLSKLEEVFHRLRKAGLKVKLGKCHLFKNKVQYLGHEVSSEGIHPSISKIGAILEYPRPKDVGEIRSFIGLASYYRKFISHFAEIAKPLTGLTKKNATYSWGEDQEEAFQKLKAALTSQPVLAYPDFDREFALMTDASQFAIGAVLSQYHGKDDRPIGYISRQLSASEINFSVLEKEALAARWAMEQYRYFLLGRRFQLVTDQSSLKWLLSLKEPKGRLLRWCIAF